MATMSKSEIRRLAIQNPAALERECCEMRDKLAIAVDALNFIAGRESSRDLDETQMARAALEKMWGKAK